MIHFYIHPYFWPRAPIPDTADVDWPGFGHGIYAWTVQTWLRLSRAGFACTLTRELPREGIVVAHRECLSPIDGLYEGSVRPTRDRFVVDMCADLAPYPFANFHIVQNVYQESTLPRCRFVPHWPQPALVGRDPGRGDRFENVAYLGNISNLPQELRSDEWQASLERAGLRWIRRFQRFRFDEPETYATEVGWNDFSQIDALVAVRAFGLGEHGYRHKPASKLVNGWMAGVPVVVGLEYQYRHMRRSDLDFIEVDTVQDAERALLRLAGDRELRRAMADNGVQRAREYDPGVLADRWVEIFSKAIVPEYARWRQGSSLARGLSMSRHVAGLRAARARSWIARRMSRAGIGRNA